MAKRIHLYSGQKTGSTVWVEGNLIEVEADDEGTPFTAILPKKNDGSYDYPYLIAYTGTIDGCAIPVKPETVREYTEIDDKNGKKVWEWSECKITDTLNREAVGYIAKFKGCFVFVEYKTKHILKLCDLATLNYTIEVVADWLGESFEKEIKGDVNNEGN